MRSDAKIGDMWADTLLDAEKGHLLRLAIWAAASLLAGTAIFALLAVRRLRSPLLVGFAVQTVAWGAIDLLLVLAGLHGLTPRDLAAATRLDRFLWLNTGLDVGFVGVGLTLAVTGWLFGRRPAAIGAGLGIIVQGAALFVLDARFTSILNGFV